MGLARRVVSGHRGGSADLKYTIHNTDTGGSKRASLAEARQAATNISGGSNRYVGQSSTYNSGISGNVGSIGGGGVSGFGGGAGGGGNMSGNISELLKQMKAKQAEANAANESRYQEILGDYESRYSSVMGGLEGMGDYDVGEARQTGFERAAMTDQRMIDSGFRDNTVAQTMRMGHQRETDRAVEGIRDNVRQYKTGLSASMLKQPIDFKERRHDVGPDMSMYSQLLSQAGQGAGGVAGSGYGTGGGGYQVGSNYGGTTGGMSQSSVRNLTGNFNRVSLDPLSEKEFDGLGDRARSASPYRATSSYAPSGSDFNSHLDSILNPLGDLMI